MFDVTQYATAAQAIVDAGRFLYDRGWSPATSSNYSARLDHDHVAITVSGRHKGQLSTNDVMVVDLNGNPVQSTAKSSAETLLHTVLYQIYPDVGAVLHTHSVKATVLSRLIEAGAPFEVEGYELQKAFPGVESHDGRLRIPVFENTQDIPALVERTREWFQHHPEQPGYLIRGHGLYTWGETMADCLRHVEAFEFLLNVNLKL